LRREGMARVGQEAFVWETERGAALKY